MERKFWLDKWEANEIGFHLSDYHPLLQKYFPKLYSDVKKVFVPLCGKSRDMAYFESQGSEVIGCELSELAAQNFFAELYPLSQEPVKSVAWSKGASYAKNNINILTGNIFDLTTNELKNITFIYDRASIVALPDKLRVQYVAHLRAIFSHAKMLLITLDYDQNIMSGPPFSVNPNEVEQLYSFAKIEQLQRSNIIDQETNFKNKGLEAFYETAYAIEW